MNMHKFRSKFKGYGSRGDDKYHFDDPLPIAYYSFVGKAKRVVDNILHVMTLHPVKRDVSTMYNLYQCTHAHTHTQKY